MVPLTVAQAERVRQLERKDGRLSREAVLADARDPNSPLHSLFDWDIERVVEAAWLRRAGEIIRSVKLMVTVEDVEVTSVAYIPDPVLVKNESGYINIRAVARSDQMRYEAAKREAERGLAALRRAYNVFVVLGVESDLLAMIGQLQETINQLNYEQAQDHLASA